MWYFRNSSLHCVARLKLKASEYEHVMRYQRKLRRFSLWRGHAVTDSRQKTPPATLKPNYKKILEAILFLINESERRGLYVTEYDIDKAVFLADVKHLNEYGRPITFDNYVAMVHGPVPSATRDILQPTFKG